MPTWPCGHPAQGAEVSFEPSQVGLHGRLSSRCIAVERETMRMDSKGPVWNRDCSAGVAIE